MIYYYILFKRYYKYTIILIIIKLKENIAKIIIEYIYYFEWDAIKKCISTK